MYKIIFWLLLPFCVFSQEKPSDSVFVKIINPKTTRVVLYGAEGAKQKYIGYDDATDGNFSVAIDAGTPKGVLRLVYDQKEMNYLDFLYTGSSVRLEFDNSDPQNSLRFTDSPVNTRYYKVLNQLANYLYLLDSLQVTYYKTKDEKQRIALVNQYGKIHGEYESFKNRFFTSEKDSMIKTLIRASVYPKPETIIDNPRDYLPYVKSHYFDNLDFQNDYLIHSPVLIDRVMDYVFYLNSSQDPGEQNRQYIAAVTDVLDRIKDDKIRAGFIKSLIQSFARDEIIVPVDYLLTEYYDKLPEGLRNDAYRYGIVHELQSAVGRTAPDFEWNTDGKPQRLSQLQGYDYYVLVFWSSTCPHCLKELPKLYDYFKDDDRVQIIMVGLETQETKDGWKSETYYYPGVIHVLGLDKWEYPPARAYNVHATPEYFVLDKDKTIIGKPYEFEDVKAFFVEELGIKKKEKE